MRGPGARGPNSARPQAPNLTSFLGFIPSTLPDGAAPRHSADRAPRVPLAARASGHSPRPPPPEPARPPGPYPPANRCTSVSLWLILSPACPPGAEAGRGPGRPRRPAASVRHWNRTGTQGGDEKRAEARLQKVAGAALPAARSGAASRSSPALTTRTGERGRRRGGAGRGRLAAGERIFRDPLPPPYKQKLPLVRAG